MKIKNQPTNVKHKCAINTLNFAPLSSEVFFAPSKQRQSVDGTGYQEGTLREGKRGADTKEPHRLSGLEGRLHPPISNGQ